MEQQARYPLKQREFRELVQLIGMLDTAVVGQEDLKERMRRIPNCWRDYCLAVSKFRHVFEQLLRSIPGNKLAKIDATLRNLDIVCKQRGVSDPNWLVMNVRDCHAMLDIIVHDNCMLCDKCGKDAQQCRIFELVEDAADGTVEKPGANAMCPFAGLAMVFGEEEET